MFPGQLIDPPPYKELLYQRSVDAPHFLYYFNAYGDRCLYPFHLY